MIDGSAIEKVAELARSAAGTITVGDDTYYPSGFHREPEDLPEARVFHDLATFGAFARRHVSDHPEAGLFVHVVNEVRVELVGGLTERQSRPVYARAVCPEPELGIGNPFDAWVSLEDARIAVDVLSSGFDTDDVIGLLSRVRVEEGTELADDGVSQAVTVSGGIEIVDRATVPGRVALAPARTFPELEQPSSDYVLRLRKTQGGLAARLFVADAGAWRNVAMSRAADALEEHAGSAVVVL